MNWQTLAEQLTVEIDGDVVPRPHAPVRPLEPVEVPHLGGGVVVHRADVDADLVLALVVAHRQVVRVHVLALHDRLGGESDDLAVPTDRLALGAAPAGDLVPRPDVALDLDPLPGMVQDGAGLDRRLGDDHVVVGV